MPAWGAWHTTTSPLASFIVTKLLVGGGSKVLARLWLISLKRADATPLSLSEPGRQQGRGYRGWGNGLKYWFFHFKTLYVLFLPTICHVISKRRNGYVCLQHLSNTRNLMEASCEKIALPPASELALPSDNPKLDRTRLNVTHLREYLTERDVCWLILKRKSRAIS